MSHIPFEELVAYWLGELEAEPLEEHFFGCGECAKRLEEVAALGPGVRAAVQAGRVSLVVSKAFLEAMRRRGMRLREYAIERGGSVECTIRAEDDAVISRLRAPLAGVKRVDKVDWIEVDGVAQRETRHVDVPFDPEAGEVLYMPPAQVVRALPKNTLRVRLLAVDEQGETPIGEYTLNHTP